MYKTWFLGLAFLCVACTGSSDDDASADRADAAPVAAEESENTNEEPQATTTPEIADEPGLPMANGVDIEQLTPKSGGGARPMLSWTAIDGAESYTVVVYDAEGKAWWSWTGSGAEVVIGGVATDAEIGGPRASSGVRWVVMGFDADGNMAGTSPRRSIEP